MDIRKGFSIEIAILEQAAKSTVSIICQTSTSILQMMQYKRTQKIMESMKMEIKCL